MIVHWHFYLMATICTLMLPLYFRKEIGNVSAIVWAYFIINAGWTGLSPMYNPTDAIHNLLIPALRGSGQLTLFLLATIPTVAILFGSKLLTFLKIGVFLNAFVCILVGFGMFNAGTFDAGVMAAFLPLYFYNNEEEEYKDLNFLGAMTVLFAVIESRSATGALVLAAVAISYMTIWKSYFYAIGAAIGCIGVSFFLQGRELFNDSGRLNAWSAYSQWWWEHGSKAFGTGFSTFDSIAAFIPNGNDTIFIWAHNDWFQLLFDAGFIGLVAGLCLFFIGLVKSRKNPALFSSFFGYGTCCLTYSPAHFIFGQLILATTYVTILKLKK